MFVYIVYGVFLGDLPEAKLKHVFLRGRKYVLILEHLFRCHFKQKEEEEEEEEKSTTYVLSFMEIPRNQLYIKKM